MYNRLTTATIAYLAHINCHIIVMQQYLRDYLEQCFWFIVQPYLGAVGASVWGVGLAGRQFLCAGKYTAPLTEHEWSCPRHPAHGGVKFPGILFMTWWAQGVMNGWLLVFLLMMCCHKASWAAVRLVAFQGVRRKPCMLPPFSGNFDPA